MALELPTLLQRYHLDSSGAVAGAHQGIGALSSLKGAFSSLKGVIGVAGIALGTFKAGQFLKDSIHEASQTQQSVKTVTSLFGDSAKQVVEWGEKNAAAFGIAKGPALQYAQQIGTVVKGFGFLPKAASDMSLSLLKVAGDMAIFKNQDPSRVVTTFQRALYGSTKGLKQYGIDVSTAKVAQTALSLGIRGTAKDWDAQTKAQVYYALIMRGTTEAVGAAKNRSHDLAVESKVLTAQLSNLRDRIGTALLPIMSAFVGLITRTALPAVTAFAGKIIQVGQAIGDKFAGPVKKAIDDVKIAILGFQVGFKNPTGNTDAFGWLGKSIIGAGQVVRRIFNDIKTAVDALSRGFNTRGADGFSSGWIGAFERIGAVVGRISDSIRKAWDKLGPILRPVFRSITDFLDTSAGRTAATAAGFTILGVSLAAIAGGPILQGLAELSNVLSLVGTAVAALPLVAGLWIGAIAAMVAAGVYFYKTNENFRHTVQHLLDLFKTVWVPRIKEAALVVRDQLVSAMHSLIAIFQLVEPPVARFAHAVADRILPAVRAVSKFVHDNLTPVLTGLGVLMGGALGVGAVAVAGSIGGLFKAFTGLGLILRIVTPLIGGPLAKAFSLLRLGITALSNPMVLVLVSLAALAAGAVYAYQHFDGFRHAVDSVASGLLSFGKSVAANVIPVLRAVGRFIHDNIVPILSGLGASLLAIASPAIIAGIAAVGEALGAAFATIGGIIAAIFSPITLLVVGIGLATGAAVYAYQHFKNFHDTVDLVGRKLVELAKAIVTNFVPAMRAVGRFFSDNIGTIGKFALIVAVLNSPLIALAAAFGLLYVKSVGFRDAIDGLGRALTTKNIESFANSVQAGLVTAFTVARGVILSTAHFIRDDLVPVFTQLGIIVLQVINGVVIPLFKELWRTVSSVVRQVVAFVKEHWVEISDVFKVVAGIITAAMTVIVAVVWAALKVIQFAWNTFGKQIMAVVRAVFEAIGGIIRGTMEVVLGVIGLFLDLITGHWGKAWHDLGHIVHGAFEVVISVARFFLKFLGNLLVAGVRAQVALFGLAWAGLKKGVELALDGVVEVLKNLPRLLLAGMLALPVLLVRIGRNIVEALVGGIAAAAPSIGRWFATLPGLILGWLRNAATFLVPIGKDILKGLLFGLIVGVDAVVVWFASLPYLLVKYLPDAAKWLYDTGKVAIHGLVVGAQFAWREMIIWAGKIDDALIKLFKNAPRWLVTAGRAIITGLFTGARFVWNQMIAWANRLDDALIKAFKNAPHWLASAGRWIINGLWTGAKAVWTATLDWYQGLGHIIVAVFKNAPRLLLSAGRWIINGLWSGARAVWKSVVSWFDSLQKIVIGAFTGAAAWLLQTGYDIMNGLWDGVKRTFTNVVAWFRAIPSQLISGIEAGGKALTWLFHLGVNILQGLLDGMNSIKNKVQDFLGGFAKKLVHVATHPWEVLSPSKVMRRLGVNIMEGLRLGLADSFPAVVSQLDAQSKSLTTKLNSVNDALARSAVTVNFAVPKLPDPTDRQVPSASLLRATHSFGEPPPPAPHPRDLETPAVNAVGANVTKLVTQLQATLAKVATAPATPFRAFVHDYVAAKSLDDVATAIKAVGFEIAGYHKASILNVAKAAAAKPTHTVVHVRPTTKAPAETPGQRFGDWIKRLQQLVPRTNGQTIGEWQAQVTQFFRRLNGETTAEWLKRLRQLISAPIARPPLPPVHNPIVIGPRTPTIAPVRLIAPATRPPAPTVNVAAPAAPSISAPVVHVAPPALSVPTPVVNVAAPRPVHPVVNIAAPQPAPPAVHVLAPTTRPPTAPAIRASVSVTPRIVLPQQRAAAEVKPPVVVNRVTPVAPRIVVPPIAPVPIRNPVDPIREHLSREAVAAPSALREASLLAGNLAAATRAGAREDTHTIHEESTHFGDVIVHAQEHTLTERGLTSELRKVERHGTLASRSGLPRKPRGKR